jgi:membrane protein
VIGSYLSEELVNVIVPLLDYKPHGTVSVLLIILALWAGSKALFAMMRITNYAYHGGAPFTNAFVGYIRERIRAIFTIIIVLITLIFALNILVFGELFVQIALRYLNDFLNENYSFSEVWYTVRWIIAFILYFFMVSAIYYVLPNTRERYSNLLTRGKWKSFKRIVSAWMRNRKAMYKLILPGSLFSAVAMIAATWGYSYYMKHIAFVNFNILYGGLSSVIVMLLWLYVMSFILVIGIQINAAMWEYDKKGVAATRI